MTSEELDDIIAAEGKPTTKRAIELSIQHWVTAKNKWCLGCNMFHDSNKGYTPSSRNCALCRLFNSVDTACVGCPLKDTGACHSSGAYGRAMRAVENGDTPAFLKACNDMLEILQAALKDITEQKTEKKEMPKTTCTFTEDEPPKSTRESYYYVGSLWKSKEGNVYYLARMGHNRYCPICISPEVNGIHRWRDPQKTIGDALAPIYGNALKPLRDATITIKQS